MPTPAADRPAPELVRGLGLTDAVVVGLGAMLGAGVFAAFAPAAAAAGSALLPALALAALIAYCNATSSARLAAIYPESGGTYVYGRRRLGPFWGHLAGWAFVVGKTASCAAMALTVGHYALPEHAHAVAVATVVALTGVSVAGIGRSALLTRVLVTAVLLVLAAVVLAGLTGTAVDPGDWLPTAGRSPLGVLQAAGLLFFAFAGYARIATLGEEVRDPVHVIPRAIALSLAVTVVVYTAVAATLLTTLGPDLLATSPAPLADAVRVAGAPWLQPVVRIGAVLGALGSLLALLLGVSRTGLAMARDGHLPRGLAVIHRPSGVPRRAELVVGLVVAVVAATADLRGAIGFSSFGVLLYYAIANASALTLDRAESTGSRLVPATGLLGCLVVAATLPAGSVAVGSAVVLAGAASFLLRRRRSAP